MTTILEQKYKTLKMSKSTKRPTVEDVFPQHKHVKSASFPALTACPMQEPKSYPVFIAELISAFNSISTSSTAPTSSSTLHTFFQGADHEAHVDGHQKKKVVKALQHADPAKVNEVISLLKAMPDPTAKIAAAVASTTATSTSASIKKSIKQPSTTAEDGKESDKKRAKKPKQEQLDKELEDWDKIDKKRSWETQKSNDQATGVVDPDSCLGITSPSWWFSSTAANPSSLTPAVAVTTAAQGISRVKATKGTKSSSPVATSGAKDAPSTGFGSLWLTSTKSKPPMNSKRSLSTGEQIALAAAALLAASAISKPKELKPETTAANLSAANKKSSTLRRQSSMPIIRTASLKALLPTSKSSPSDCKAIVSPELTTPSYLAATFNSITRQFLALQQGPPSLNVISAYTFWWGYEIYVPHKCMATIERVTDVSQIFFNILSGAISGIPGLAALVPIAKIISAWVGYQWSVIKAEDVGKGVVISATWVLPVALASRQWDHPCCEESDDKALTISMLSPLRAKRSIKSKLNLIGM